MNSIWTETVELPHFEKLQENIKTDVLVIGGGMAGILCAYMLEQAGVDYALVEASKICSGITQNTTGKITSQHGLIYHELLDRFGVEKTRMYLDANNRALENYRSLCSNIECDFEEKDAFVYAVKNVELCAKELDVLGKIGYSASFASSIPLPFDIAGAVKFKNQAQFHPLKFIAGIAPGLRIYENTFVKEIRNHTAVTSNGEIQAGKIIVATHFPFLNRHGSYFLKMYQHRSYVIAFENASKINGMYLDEAEKGMSFRNYKNLLLVGGGDHRTGKQGGNWAEIKNFTNIYYCGLEERGRWATQDCMTLDNVPYIGQYSANTPDLYVATGFNKWGMTSS
ncbi:MAG: FAD-binding oxidoreductase, partial [Ruminococcus sp.]|nr:FAD-binding oxidoreductase [Ruminococcus sp.]